MPFWRAGAWPKALLLVLLTLVDKLVEAHPLSAFLLYVDDLGAHSRGKDEATVAKCTLEMSQHVVEILEGELGLTISRRRRGFASDGDKTICVGSKARLRALLKQSLSKKGFHVRERAKHLGVDYGPGCARRFKQAQKKRFDLARSRLPRIRRLGGVAGLE